MQTSASTAARTVNVASRPWRDDLLTAIGRSHIVEVEPVPWLSHRQAPRVDALIEQIRAYHALPNSTSTDTDRGRAQRRQARDIAARLVELQKFGVRVRWTATEDRNLRIICQRARR